MRKLAILELRAVDGILDEIEHGVDELGVLAPEHQRLELLLWMARARSCVERSTSGEVNRAVAKVAKRLGELAKLFWPGSVRALQLAAHPGDVVPLNARRAHDPRSWADAASVVEQLRQERRDLDARLGRDRWGWADLSKLKPRPDDARKVLTEVESQLGKLRGSGNGSSAPGKDDDVDVHAAEQAALRLRWLRGAVPGGEWGTAMGSLRRGSQPLGTEASRLRELLDPGYAPKVPWAEVIAAPPPDPAEEKREREERERREPQRPVVDVDALRAAMPPANAPREDVIRWLEQGGLGADVETLATLAASLLSQLDDIAELNLLPDRASRRRVRNVVRRIRGEDVLDAHDHDVSDATDASDEGEAVDDVSRREIEELVARIRELTHGKSALFISNRDDPELAKRLTSMLGLQLTWAEATPRRVDAVVERIERGTYDYVLSATGFQDHSVDAAIAKAAKTGAVPLVRVNRGRPLACVLALARTLGVRAATSPAAG